MTEAEFKEMLEITKNNENMKPVEDTLKRIMERRKKELLKSQRAIFDALFPKELK